MSIINGTSFNDTLIGTAGDDTLIGGGGDDFIDGNSGVDTAAYAGGAGEYQLGLIAGELIVTDRVFAGGNDGTDTLIHIQRLLFADRIYTISSEFQANTTTAGDQRSAVPSALAGGGFLQVWQSGDQDGGGLGIYARRFDAAGSAAGAELQVNTTTLGDQFDPDVTTLASGNLAVVWTSTGQDGSLGGVYGQLIAPDGTFVGSEFLVNSWTADDQGHAQVVALNAGGFAVCWSSRLQDGSGEGVYARLFTSTGASAGNAFRVNTVTAGDQMAPSITALANGGFIVAWQSLQQDGSSFGVFAQRYNATGVPQGFEFQLNEYVTGNQLAPEITALAGGGAVLVWASQNQDGSGYGIYARLLDASGAPSGSEFAVNQTTSRDQQNPAVVGLDSGGFMVAWESRYQDGAGLGVYARGFNADGSAAGAEFRANSTTLGHQMAPGLAALPGGGAALSWTSVGQDGDQGSIFAQMFNAAGVVIGPAMLQGTTGDDVLDISGNGPLQVAGLSGNDTYVVNETGDQLIEGTNAGIDTVQSSISWTLAGNFENLLLLGSANIAGTGNEFANQINGNSGNNTLDGAAGADTLAGASGNDDYYIDTLDTVIEWAVTGIDTVYTPGSYVLPANVENAVVTGTASAILTGSSDNNLLVGNAGDDLLKGRFGNDTLQGGAGADTLDGGRGTDVMTGSTGDDYYVVDAGDLITELAGEGTDAVESATNWTLDANFENLILSGLVNSSGTGNSAANQITGDTSNNLLGGAGGDDRIDGSSGLDTINGGAGNDTLTGNKGSDAFLFDTALSAATNVDLLDDFSIAVDAIWLDDDVFTTFNAGVSSAVSSAQFYRAAGATAAHDADDRIVYDTTSGKLYYDPDGINGAPAVLFAVIGTDVHPVMNASLFLIVN